METFILPSPWLGVGCSGWQIDLRSFSTRANGEDIDNYSLGNGVSTQSGRVSSTFGEERAIMAVRLASGLSPPYILYLELRAQTTGSIDVPC